ncbi:signal transduction histidine kinase [Lachnospiraceae bacterium PF1-22]|uniref:sensor histidine kinase n=1 Tax=Ohessyouella blattaphilus TaxID=2949333 RepID=UPI003E272B2E
MGENNSNGKKQWIRVLSNLSHELRTPLTIVSNYAQLAKEHARRKGKADDYTIDKMRLITSEVERMAMMVDQALDIERIREGKMCYQKVDISLNELIGNIIEVCYPVLNKNRNRLQVNLCKELLPVSADEQRIRQVLINLINNALSHTRNGEITIGTYSQQNEAVITVQDTGIGMEEWQLETIFDYDGENGYGLYISQAIITDHNGRITANSQPGSGSVFLVYLPITSDIKNETEVK